MRINLSFNINTHRGVALITVMLIVALAAIIASQMTARLQLQMQRTSNISSNQQAYWYAMGAEVFAKRVLINSFKDDKESTNLSQPWAQGETSYPVDYGNITGEISDLQACFNLNALRTASSSSSTSSKSLPREAFERLIVALNIEGIGNFEAEYMSDALNDWLDEDGGIASAGGAEDNDYSSKAFPYLAANHYLSSINELRVVEHFSPQVINELKEYVCVLPNTNQYLININTISAKHPQLLEALLDIPRDDAETILSARPPEGFKDTDEFFKLPEVTQQTLTDEQKELFAVDSEYFTLKTTASFNGSYFSLNSIMKIEQNNQINVITRIIGRD